MPCFCNPTGAAMSDAAKAELVALLDRAGVPLIEDDVNCDLYLDTQRPRAAKAFDRSGNVLLCSSVSKTLAPGYRIGWALPGRWKDRVIAGQWSTTISANTPGQIAIAMYLRSDAFERQLRQLRGVVKHTMQRASAAIARHFPPGTSMTRPRGGLVLWLGLPGGIDSRLLQRRARARDVSIMPGEMFSARATYRGFIRISCGLPYTPELEAALARLGAVVHELAR
jgi:DNA-binding transcriptional MocR family regulator